MDDLRPKPSLGLHLLLGAGTAMLTVASMSAAVLVFALGASLSGFQAQNLKLHPWLLVVGALLSQTSVLLVALGCLRFWARYQGIPRRQAFAECFPLALPSAGSLLGALLVVFGLTPLAVGLASAVGDVLHRESPSEEVVRIAASAPPLTFAALWFCIAVLPGLFEEALFRGFVTRLYQGWRWVAWIVPSLLFGLVHLDVVQSVGTAILGLGFGWIRLRTNTLVPSMVAHTVYNGTVLLAARFAGASDESESMPIAMVLGGCVLAALGSWLLGMPTPQAEDEVAP